MRDEAHPMYALAPMTGPWFAQHGEDEILSSMLTSHRGMFVEVGAADGIEGSNTLHFEQRGWRGVLIEANPHLAARCRNVRQSVVVERAVTAPGAPNVIPFQIVTVFPQLSGLDLDSETLRKYGVDDLETILVPTSTLDEVLSEYLHDNQLDFITIDVEGHEWSVLQGFSINVWKPRIVIVERNYHPNWRIFRYMHEHGYAYTRTTGVNDWFERGVAQSTPQLVRAALPLYALGVRPTLKKTLSRLHLLKFASAFRRQILRKRAN